MQYAEVTRRRDLVKSFLIIRVANSVFSNDPISQKNIDKLMSADVLRTVGVKISDL